MIQHRIHFIFSAFLYQEEEWRALIETLSKNHFAIFIASDAHSIEKYIFNIAKFGDKKQLNLLFSNKAEEINFGISLNLFTIAIKLTPADITCENVTDLFKQLHISAPYQLQYLPQIKYVKNQLQHKMGYPSSLLQEQHSIVDDALFRLSPYSLDFHLNNVGDPYTDSQSWQIDAKIFEQDIIQILGAYYGLDKHHSRGYVTSGGTEGNFAALWWAREQLNAEKIALYYSTATHYSIPKIANQLRLQAHPIPTNLDGEMDTDALAQSLKTHMKETPQIPIIINANAGTTLTGAIDDLCSIKSILQKEVKMKGGRSLLHLDAASLGAILPLLKPFGSTIKNYFKELEISTLTLSGHKFFGTNLVCGVILTTKEFLEKSLSQHALDVFYNSGAQDITASGSRSGHAVFHLHNLLYGLDLHTNQAGLKNIWHTCQQHKQYCYDQLSMIIPKTDLRSLAYALNIIFPKPSNAIIKKYTLMPVDASTVGISIQSNVTKKLIDQFIKDYKADR